MKLSSAKTRNAASFALAFFLGGIVGCGGSSTTATADTGSTMTQAQFDADLQASTLYKNMQATITSQGNTITAQAVTISSQAATITSLQMNQTSDEAALAKVEAFGHSRSATVAASSRRTDAVAIGNKPRTQAITYGPCSDMGQSYGNASPDPTSTTVKYYKQCPINGAQYIYGVIVQTGAIAQPAFLWFDQPNCQGNGLIFENDGAFNRSTLQKGVVFNTPDGIVVTGATELMISAGQTAQTIQAASVYDPSAHTCNPDTENKTGYLATPNDVNVTGVPAVVPSDFID